MHIHKQPHSVRT